MADSLIELVDEFKRLDRKRKLLGKLPLADAARFDHLRITLAQRLHGNGSSERRQELRIPTSLRVRYRTGETFIHNYIHNLSSGGVFISTPNPLPLDTKIKLHLVFEDEGKEVELEGKVVWENIQGSASHDITRPGMGVKFVKISEEARDIIDNLIHNAITEQAQAEEERKKKGEEKERDKKAKKPR